MNAQEIKTLTQNSIDEETKKILKLAHQGIQEACSKGKFTTTLKHSNTNVLVNVGMELRKEGFRLTLTKSTNDPSITIEWK